VHLKDGLGAARRCDCSYCRRRGTPTASVARADLRIVKGDDNLTLYSFGTHTAKHYFCKTCSARLAGSTRIISADPTQTNTA